MIPLRDANPSRSFPFMIILLIGANVAIFLYELSLSKALNDLFNNWALIPDDFTGGVLNSFKRSYTLITSQFLHGGWLHLIGNMWFLWIFGDNIEDHLGHFKFLLFYLLCGMAAGLTHIYTNPASPVPTVGASGAIAGVMGAYTILYPRAKVLTLIPFFIFIHFVEIPAFIFLGIWFLIQFFSGTLALTAGDTFTGIAWWAHIGGFVVGIIFVLLIPGKKKRF